MEVKMTEVFQNQQLTYELIAALFGEERIEYDESGEAFAPPLFCLS